MAMVSSLYEPKLLSTIVLAFIGLWFLHRLFQRFSSSKGGRGLGVGFSNIPGPKPVSWWAGNLPQIFNSHKGWEFHGMMLEKFGATVSYHGLLGSRRLYTSDPKALYHILVKDQAQAHSQNTTGIGIYEESPSFITFNNLVFGPGLLSTIGLAHRKQRKVLNPVFGVRKIKGLVPIFYEVAHRVSSTVCLMGLHCSDNEIKLETTLKQKVHSGPQEIDILSWLSRASLEFIGRSGLGYSFDPLKDDAPAHEYTRNLKELVQLSVPLMFLRIYVIPWAVKIGSPAFRRAVCKWVPWKRVRRIQELIDYMWSVSEEIYLSKRKELEEMDSTDQEEEQGADILKVLIRENRKASSEDRLDEAEILGQLSTLIFAAQDTTSNAMTRMISLLSLHPQVQTKLREEITQARAAAEGDLDYDQLEMLPYLEAVCRETLRLFPPVPLLFRTALRDAILPLSKPISSTNGSTNEIFIPQGTQIMISIINCNRDPDIWGQDAMEWKPERWLEPLPDAVLEAKIPGVYSPLMTFNAGGRSCIGFKFSQLEMKVVMSILVELFKFSPAPNKEIVWQMSTVATPVVVDGDSSLPQLPVVIELA
ncbi:hypothetical protein VKT23_005090 [Stygiomarasmius scandens]|uniref:Cytochrome P450 n=1 Tax=Marasmiellus scandens TaxID=2682957 RepID=A0ABR1JYL2_9AGAR